MSKKGKIKKTEINLSTNGNAKKIEVKEKRMFTCGNGFRVF
jgi:hypothetical protein